MKIRIDKFPFTIFSDSEIRKKINVILSNHGRLSENGTLAKILLYNKEVLNASSTLLVLEGYSKMIKIKVQNDYESLLKESVEYLNKHPQFLRQQVRTLLATLYAMSEYENKAGEMSEVFKYWPRMITRMIKKRSFDKALTEEIVFQIKKDVERGEIIILSIIAVLLCHLKHNISSRKDVSLIINELITFSSGEGVAGFYVKEMPLLFSSYDVRQMKDFILSYYNDILNDARTRGADSILYNCVELYVEKIKCDIEKEE